MTIPVGRSGRAGFFSSLILCMVPLYLAVGLSGCMGLERAPEFGAFEEVAPPVGQRSAQPRLHVGEDGLLYLSWIERGAARAHAFKYATFDGERWSDPVTIAEGDDWFVNWADTPSLTTLSHGRLAAHYLVKSGPGTYAYDVHIVQSADGETWSEALTPHQRGLQAEHGFASLLPWTGGSLLSVWLDGRNTTGGHGGHEGGHGSHGGPMTVQAAVISPRGGIIEDEQLDASVCDCCWTAAVRTENGAVVAYRNRTEDEIRDIWITRYVDERWTTPVPLYEDGWQIAACPVNGPALATNGWRVAAAWFTAADDQPVVNVTFSDSEGERFGNPTRVDAGAPLGRADVAMLEDGSAVVSWLEGGPHPAIMIRRITALRRMDEPVIVADVSSSRATGVPRIARIGDDLFLAWVDDTGVRVARSRLATRPF
jgi:hypothetical protein